MKSKMIVGIFGAPINNTNLGCQALAYSLVNLLYHLAEKKDIDCRFLIFEYINGESNLHKFCNTLMLDESKFEHIHLTAFGEIRSYIKHPRNNFYVLKKIKECDWIIDLTEGDSFSDIYGKRRFNSLTKQKDIICKMNIPLILGPQTYGPFNIKKNEKYVAKIIKKAEVVVARDYISAELIEKISKKKVPVTTDLAFQLPYHKNNKDENLKIGVNISGLLVKNQTEKNDKAFILKADYDCYISQLLNYLTSNVQNKIYLIPHVREDCIAIENFHKLFPQTIVVDMFDNPIQAKSMISQMNIFIGSRMHATIAAFTSGVLTIPVAYSRKFEGLFSVVDYPCVIDLYKYDTEEAISLTKEYIENRQFLKEKMNCSLEISREFSKKTEKIFDQIFENMS